MYAYVNRLFLNFTSQANIVRKCRFLRRFTRGNVVGCLFGDVRLKAGALCIGDEGRAGRSEGVGWVIARDGCNWRLVIFSKVITLRMIDRNTFYTLNTQLLDTPGHKHIFLYSQQSIHHSVCFFIILIWRFGFFPEFLM